MNIYRVEFFIISTAEFKKNNNEALCRVRGGGRKSSILTLLLEDKAADAWDSRGRGGRRVEVTLM